jgi:hypothetical protein
MLWPRKCVAKKLCVIPASASAAVRVSSGYVASFFFPSFLPPSPLFLLQRGKVQMTIGQRTKSARDTITERDPQEST